MPPECPPAARPDGDDALRARLDGLLGKAQVDGIGKHHHAVIARALYQRPGVAGRADDKLDATPAAQGQIARHFLQRQTGRQIDRHGRAACRRLVFHDFGQPTIKTGEIRRIGPRQGGDDTGAPRRAHKHRRRDVIHGRAYQRQTHAFAPTLGKTHRHPLLVFRPWPAVLAQSSPAGSPSSTATPSTWKPPCCPSAKALPVRTAASWHSRGAS